MDSVSLPSPTILLQMFTVAGIVLFLVGLAMLTYVIKDIRDHTKKGSDSP